MYIVHPHHVDKLWTKLAPGILRTVSSVKIEIRGVERLSFRERQVVALKESGHSNDAVARILGISSSTVATLFNRARSKGYEVAIILPGESMGLFKGPEDEEND